MYTKKCRVKHVYEEQNNNNKNTTTATKIVQSEERKQNNRDEAVDVNDGDYDVQRKINKIATTITTC